MPGNVLSNLGANRYAPAFVGKIRGLSPTLDNLPDRANEGGRYGMRNDVFRFTTHIDSYYATTATPFGALLHGIVDVFDSGKHRTRGGE